MRTHLLTQMRMQMQMDFVKPKVIEMQKEKVKVMYWMMDFCLRMEKQKVMYLS